MHTVQRHRGWTMVGAILLGLAAGGADVVLAQQSPGNPPASQSGPFLSAEDRVAIGHIFWRRAQEKLGLSDQQAADMRALLQDRRTTARADVRALAVGRRQLRSLLEQSNSDPAAIQTAATEVKALQGKLFDQRLQTQLAIRSMLTAEQWQKWNELGKGRGHRSMRRGSGSGMGWR